MNEKNYTKTEEWTEVTDYIYEKFGVNSITVDVLSEDHTSDGSDNSIEALKNRYRMAVIERMKRI